MRWRISPSRIPPWHARSWTRWRPAGAPRLPHHRRPRRRRPTGRVPDDLRSLGARPWFADGLEREEAAFITAIMPLAYEAPHLYAGLLESHHTLSRTVALPLAGDIALWAFQDAPFPDDDLLGVVEEAVQVMEGFMERPSLPGTSSSWLLREAPVQRASALPGTWAPTSASPFPPAQSSQTAQAPSFMSWPLLLQPRLWSRMAPGRRSDFMTAYMRHRTGRQSLELRREATAAGRATCIEGGIANISHLNRLYDPVPGHAPVCLRHGRALSARGARAAERTPLPPHCWISTS